MSARHENFKVAEEAAEWLHRMRYEAGPETQAAFSAWIREASAHLEEFLMVAAVWDELGQLDAQTRARLEGAISPESVVRFPVTQRATAAVSRAVDAETIGSEA